MRRADRLFQLVQELRRVPVVTAAVLARRLEVSERMIYRDIRDLITSGVPIDGEAGVGYTLRRGYDLPPLMFTEAEIEGMVLGARVVSSWGDRALARAAAGALARVEAAVPERLRSRLRGTPLFAPGFHIRPEQVALLGEVRSGIESGHKLRLHYRDAGGVLTQRTVWPLGLFFWGSSWSVAAWCELRTDFRNFRLDRIDQLEGLPDQYPREPGRTLQDYVRLEDEGS